MCKEKSRIFHGRDKEIEQIIEYIRKPVDRYDTIPPLVVYGESGCGKTSVIAKAASLVKEEFDDYIQVTRFLGTTSESSTLSKLLHSVCCQIQRATEVDIDTTFPQVMLWNFRLFIIKKVNFDIFTMCTFRKNEQLDLTILLL